MGYADPNQVGSGLRQRLYSRAFIIADLEEPESRFVYLVLDTQSGDTAVRYGILEGLASMGTEYGVYGQSNVAVTGTHSHSGPGAWLNYLLPQITSKGFDKQSYQAIVDGALLSIRRAHESLTVGHLDVGTIDVEDANINRSPFAYLANPKEERDRYAHNVDKTLTMLRFKRAGDNLNMGVLTWFPVHGTSMLGNNTLISGDNKGVAAKLLEDSVETSPDAHFPLTSPFVAGFSQANVGDTSPNVLGAYCEDGSGSECNFEDSTCGGKNEPCHGRGPHFREQDQGASSCFEIGRRQFAAAKELLEHMDSVSAPIRGAIKSLHTFKDLSNYTFPHPNGSIVHTCPAALGYSFAAGTTDGPGAFDFKQNNTGSPNANPVWSVVRNFLREPSEEQKVCHGLKPILLDVGEISRPYLWTPNIVDIQILRVGQLLIIVSPGEATTMAGRRWKEALAASASEVIFSSENEPKDPSSDPIVVLGGPANSYTHYIATEEEYSIQRYEGASTLYGSHTLNAYINLTLSYLPYLASDASESIPRPPRGPQPPIHINSSLSFIRGVVYDRPPLFKNFGDPLTDVPSSVLLEKSTKVSATFVAANPRNNLRLENSFAEVQMLVVERKKEEEEDVPVPKPIKAKDDNDHDEPIPPATTETWITIRDDSDWDLIFQWRRINSVLATSEVDITWELGQGTKEVKEGIYRIVYHGDSKALGSGEIESFKGVSSAFRVEGKGREGKGTFSLETEMSR